MINHQPDRIGPYHVLQSIGEGGMGTVYLCAQREPIRRTVAVKVLKPGLDTRQVIGRFEAERQALAVMDHPNIARVFDAGTSESGHPYFVMEYVKGVMLTDFSDGRRLATRDRLQLFIAVCHAVQHAHHKGIIHRDLKPSNLLVTEVDGTAMAKVIDFGIAKAINWRLTDRTFATELGQRLGTPAYMSPEQWEASGLDVDTRTDVYSLGVVLYELLVGRLPVEPEALVQAGPGAAEMLMHSAPRTPSSRLDAETGNAVAALRATDRRSLRRLLSGDLDWIVLRAMEGDRRRRYQTAQELADDLGRFLRSEPVQARPPAALYRMSRFARRHRIGTGVAALLLGLGAVFTGLTLQQARRLSVEKARAEAAAARAQAFGDFLQAALLSPDPIDGLGRDATMLQVLDTAVARLDRQPLAVPVVEAAVRSDIGWAYFKLAMYDRAEPLLRRALELLQRSGGHDSAALAQGLMRAGALHEKLGRTDSAAWNYAEAMTLQRQRGGEADPRLAELLAFSGAFWRDRGDTAAARRQLSEALAIWQRRSDSAGIASTEEHLGVLSYATGDLETAARYLHSSVAYRRRQRGEQARLAVSLNSLGAVLEDLGRGIEAESSYREALRLGEQALGPDHDEVTATLNNLGLLLSRSGRVPEAVSLLRRALSTDERKMGRDNLAVGIDAITLGGVLCRFGDAAEGLALSRRAEVITTRYFGPGSWQVAQSRLLMARCLGRLGRRTEALPLAEAALGDLERAPEAEQWRADSARALIARLRQ